MHTVKKLMYNLSTTDVPCAIGLGIATPEQAKEISDISDGAIVGSTIVKIVEKYGRHSIEPVCAYIKSMKDAIKPIIVNDKSEIL